MSYLSNPTGSRLRGRYRVSGSTNTGVGTNFAAGSTQLFQFRWSDSSRFAVIRSVSISSINSTAAFASSGLATFDIARATAWTVQGSAGTALDVGSQNKTRSTMPSSVSVAGDIRAAPTSALAAGTSTIDTNAMGTISVALPAALGQVLAPTFLYFAGSDDDSPLTLGFQEGYVVRFVTAIATGQIQSSMTVEWSEFEPA